MKKSVLVFAIAAITAATSAQAEVNVDVHVGLPTARVIAPVPLPPTPTVVFEVAPQFITPPGLGFYVAVDTPYDLFLNSNFYYLFYGNAWHRARHHNGPWVAVPFGQLPLEIRRHRIEQIRSHRDREYRVYHENRAHYRGRSFRPDHERREQREHIREERRERDHGRHGRD